MIRKTQAYSKRFGVLVTGYANKYRTDIFFRTEANIIGLQVLFSFALVALVVVIFSYLYYDISTTIIRGVNESIELQSGSDAASRLISELQNIKLRNISIIILISALLTAIFGYVIAKITLFPARNALKSQKKFISNVAHELRTPLSIIKTNSEVAMLDQKIDKRFKIITSSNLEELDRISDIINNLLSLSAFTQPERMAFFSVDLCQVISEVINKLSPLSDRKNLEIKFKRERRCEVWGNPAAIEQIVSNILKNSISFTPESGKIAVSVESNASTVSLTVSDNGIGMSKEDLEKAFDPFYRSDKSRNRQKGGSGLGLTIVNELIKMHKGKISLQSALGKGTIAKVIFQKSKDQISKDRRKADSHKDAVEIDFSAW